MGCGFSSSAGALRPFAGVRVIHVNGYVEDFEGPAVTVAHVTGKSASGTSPSRYVLCSSAHLLQPGRGPFRPDEPLQPGTVYFLLPHSVFQSESSAIDLACLMNRLTALARKGAAAASPVEALFKAEHDRDQQPAVPKGPAVRCCKEAAAALPAPWKPRLDRIDESIGRASMRSSSSCSACSTEA